MSARARDLFPDTLPAAYRDAGEGRALAWGLISDWFGTLSYPHNESTHAEILESLKWPRMPEVVCEASLHHQDEPIDFDFFAAGVRHQARRAERAGLVVPDGKPRQRRASVPPPASHGNLFGEGE